MKVHDLYRSVRVKALEVCEALTAVEKVRGMSGPSATIDEIVTHFTTYRLFPFEVDIQKDTRRHVKLLYADYCTLRDELIKLLQTDVSVASQVKPLKVELELPDDDPHSAKVQGSEMEGDTLHLCISVTDRAAQK